MLANHGLLSNETNRQRKACDKSVIKISSSCLYPTGKISEHLGNLRNFNRIYKIQCHTALGWSLKKSS